MTKAEIICFLDIIDSNCTFSAANKDVEKYERMFPDSAIAKNYQWKATEHKYKPKPGVALWTQNLLSGTY